MDQKPNSARGKTCKFFSVCTEQLPLVLCFVDATNSVCEEFVEFIHCDAGTSGNAVAGKILEVLEEYGLNVDYLCGQAFDGAGNMAGKYRGAAAIIPKGSVCPLCSP